ncbi:hypothetical protein ACNOYE_39020 [Nannocystaceae bacterium ST9]
MQLRLRSFAPITLVLALVPVLSACPSDDDGGTEEVGETGTTDESGSETNGTTDESGGDQGSSSESESDSTETGPDSADTTETTDSSDSADSVSDTGTTGDPGLTEELCMQGCAVFSECVGEIPGCLEECITQHDALDGECLGFEQALTACIGGLTCEELDQFLESSPEPYPCQAEEAQVCEGNVCEVGVGMGENPEECSFEYICPNDPVYSVECTANGCSCFEDGVEVGGCSEAAQFCAAVGETDAANTCCGWQL